MTDHDDIVERFVKQLEEAVEDTEWDAVIRETEYFSPDEDSKYHENPKGEMDVGLYKFGERIFYLEIKTNPSDIGHGYRQIERAEEFFEEHYDIEVEGFVYMEDVDYD